VLGQTSAHGLAARSGKPMLAAQRGRAHGVVTAPGVPAVARLVGAHRRPRRDEVRTLSISIVWHGSWARWWGWGRTVVTGHR
jgi:hypothetical protein